MSFTVSAEQQLWIRTLQVANRRRDDKNFYRSFRYRIFDQSSFH